MAVRAARNMPRMELVGILIVAVVFAVMLATIAGLAAARVLIHAAETGLPRHRDVNGPRRSAVAEEPTENAP